MWGACSWIECCRPVSQLIGSCFPVDLISMGLTQAHPNYLPTSSVSKQCAIHESLILISKVTTAICLLHANDTPTDVVLEKLHSAETLIMCSL